VDLDLGNCYELVPGLRIRPLTRTGALVRHDPERLALTLMEIATGSLPAEMLPVPVTAST
jgi:hypothetical protein